MKIKEFGIEKQTFAQFNNLDRLERDHSFIAKMLREQIKLLKYEALIPLDKEIAENYKKGFCEVNIDWDKQMLLVIPTNDPAKKAEEVDQLIKVNSKN
jgi:hypothetical protein